jgi:hypothetical protein
MPWAKYWKIEVRTLNAVSHPFYDLHSDIFVLRSGFSESQLVLPERSNSVKGKKSSNVPRRVVTITDDFDLFHALLFYIYTGRVCFTASPESFHGEFGDCPLIANGEGMYALAHRLLFDSITSKALDFIQTTCNIKMVTACVFGSFGSIYQVVGRVYYNYFMTNWSEVIKTPEFENFFGELEEDSAEYIRINRQFRDMVRAREESLARSRK